MKPSKNINRLIEIMAALRHPETGCPWDIEQDFRSIAPYTIEEAFEVADAIEREDHEDLRDELGDLLLQVIYHARMAQEQVLFEFGDVVNAICEKMIRRHPHVFGDEEARAAGMAKGAWERIKQKEKRLKAEKHREAGLSLPLTTSALDGVPPSLPALTKALKLQQKAARVGFDWDNTRDVIAKIREELDEVEEELDRCDSATLANEIGDALFAITNLARHYDIEAESALRSTNQKFINRFRHIEAGLESRGIALEDASLAQMEELWQEAKITTHSADRD